MFSEFLSVKKFISFLLNTLGIINKSAMNDLYPFYDKDTVKDTLKYYLETHLQQTPPHDADEPQHTAADSVREKLFSYLLRTFKLDSERYYMILAGPGMGKTTFLLSLYFRYKEEWVVPKFNIRLVQLGHPRDDEEIKRLAADPEQARSTILLLDALDEDPKALKDHKKRIDELLRLAIDFRKVVITCRTQFFATKEIEPFHVKLERYGADGGFYNFRTIYLSPFSDKEVERYLWKRFGISSKRKLAKKIVRNAPSLASRPLLLSKIKLLLERRKKHSTVFSVYRDLIEEWINRESQKQLSIPNGYTIDEIKLRLWEFSEEFALKIYAMESEEKKRFIPLKVVEDLASIKGIKVSLLDIKSRSLLNRNSEGSYKFSHRSIYDFFIAKAVAYGNFSHNRKMIWPSGFCITLLQEMINIKSNVIHNFIVGEVTKKSLAEKELDKFAKMNKDQTYILDYKALEGWFIELLYCRLGNDKLDVDFFHKNTEELINLFKHVKSLQFKVSGLSASKYRVLLTELIEFRLQYYKNETEIFDDQGNRIY